MSLYDFLPKTILIVAVAVTAPSSKASFLEIEEIFKEQET